MFVINVMTDWLPRWKENGWKTISGKCIANEDDIRQLDNSASGVNIKWVRKRYNTRTTTLSVGLIVFCGNTQTLILFCSAI
jgi:ribonuclease HI